MNASSEQPRSPYAQPEVSVLTDAASRQRCRKRNRTVITGAVLCVSLGLVWVVSDIYECVWRCPRLMISLYGGAIHIHRPAPYPLEWPSGDDIVFRCRIGVGDAFLSRKTLPGLLGGLPQVQTLPPLDFLWVEVPLWLLITLIFVPTVYFWRAAHPPDGGLMCATCGYDLTGNRSGVCPECGTPTTESANKRGGSRA